MACGCSGVHGAKIEALLVQPVKRLFLFATPPERYWRRKKVTIVSNVFYFVFSMDDTLSVLRPIHPPYFANAYEKCCSYAEICSRLLWAIIKNWSKSWYFIRGVDAFQNLLYVCSENCGFLLFLMVPSGKPNSPPCFSKNRISKKRHLQKAYENNINWNSSFSLISGDALKRFKNKYKSITFSFEQIYRFLLFCNMFIKSI